MLGIWSINGLFSKFNIRGENMKQLCKQQYMEVLQAAELLVQEMKPGTELRTMLADWPVYILKYSDGNNLIQLG